MQVQSDLEMVNPKERTRSAEQKRTWRPSIPSYWHPDLPDKTTVGFTNNRIDCYRNVVLQMLLHMPIFYNWLIWYKKHHAPEGHQCKLGVTAEGPTECPVCQLATIAQGYWTGKSESAEIWKSVLESLTRSLVRIWKPAGVDSEQDPAEFFQALYKEIKSSTKPMMQGDLQDMFEAELIMVKKCAGATPCVDPTYDSRHELFVRITFSEEEGQELPEKPTLSDIVARHFDRQDDYGVCINCKGARTATEQIGSFPELLLIQLNRIDSNFKKIKTRVYPSEHLNIETRFIDERWGNKRTAVQYKLTSVVLHTGDDFTHGHFSVGVKGKGDEWVKANDLKITDWDPEQSEDSDRSDSYLFTYRRVPILNEVQTAEGVNPPEPESNSEGLVKLLDVVIPKVLDTYLARTAESRRKEFEQWASEWEKKTVKENSATGPEIGDKEEILNWSRKRGRLGITLTADKGKGARLLELEVQGLHYNRLKNNKREREEDLEKGKGKSFKFFKKSGKDDGKDGRNGRNGKKTGKK